MNAITGEQLVVAFLASSDNLIMQINFCCGASINFDWEQRKLKDMLLVHSDKDYKSLKKGNIPVFGTGGYITSVSKSLSSQNAIGLGRKGTINKPYILKAPFWTVDTLFFLTVKNGNKLDYLLSVIQRINWLKYDESTGLPSLSKKNIENVSVYITQCEEQAKIGQLIKKLDSLIDLQQRKLKQLKIMQKYFFEKTLPFQGKLPVLRFTKLPYTTYRFSELYRKSTSKNDGSIPKNRVISVANMRWGNIPKNSSISYMKSYFVFNKGDIAYEGNRSKKYSFGRFVENDLGMGIVSHVFNVFKPLVSLDHNYMKTYINSEQVMREHLRMSTSRTTMMNNLVPKDLAKQKLLLPPLKEQSILGNAYKNIQNMIDPNIQKEHQLILLKKFLLQNLFI